MFWGSRKQSKGLRPNWGEEIILLESGNLLIPGVMDRKSQ
jgi:hypothetical protein